jgi:hypothetical protein
MLTEKAHISFLYFFDTFFFFNFLSRLAGELFTRRPQKRL